MRNRQTCTIRYLHLILPAIAVMEVKTIEVTRQVVRRAGVQDPVRPFMRGGGVGGRVGGAVVAVIAAATVRRLMSPVLTYLAPRVPATAATPIASSIAAVATGVAVVTARGTTLGGTVACLSRRKRGSGGAAATWASGIGHSTGVIVVGRPGGGVRGGLPVLNFRLLLL